LPDSTDRPRFLAAGLYGVWGWRGVIGKETGANGERRDVKGVIRDFQRVVFEERKITILFDSDTKTNEKVQAARTALARYLIYERKAQVYLADVPDK